jgi:hypothetical protein
MPVARGQALIICYRGRAEVQCARSKVQRSKSKVQGATYIRYQASKLAR